MLLADCCFNITHERFSYDLDEIMQRAEDHKVQYFFAPASKESEIFKLLNFCENYDEKIYCSVGIHPIMHRNLSLKQLLILRPI